MVAAQILDGHFALLYYGVFFRFIILVGTLACQCAPYDHITESIKSFFEELGVCTKKFWQRL